jgi:hypothetical protein
MYMSKSIDLIQSQNNGRITDSGHGFVTNFGIPSRFKVDVINFSPFYTDILGLSLKEMNAMQIESVSPVFDATKFGLPFCEEIMNDSPIIITMNFEFDDRDNSIFYDANFVVGIAKELQEIIMTFISIPDINNINEPEQLRCFILETPIWSNNNKQYQTLRFQFPYTRIPIQLINGFVIKELIIALRDKDYVKGLTVTPLITDWNMIIQKVDNHIPMYGSKITADSAPLILRSILSIILEYDPSFPITDERNETYYIEYDTYDEINPLDSFLVHQHLLDENDISFNTKRHNLPLVLSIWFYGKYSQIIPNSVVMGDEEAPRPFVASTAGVVDEEDQIAMFNSLIGMVSRDRFTMQHKYYWYSLGKMLFNIYNASKLGLNVYTALSSSELQPLCEKTWESFGNEYLDIRIIMEYAQQDSPDKYRMWHKEYCRPIIEAAKSGRDMVVAELVKRMFFLEFIYCSESGLWYYKKKSSLIRDIGGLELKNLISRRLKVPYFEMKEEYEQRLKDAPTPDQKKIFRGLIVEVEKFINSLDGGNYLELVIKSAKCKMYDNNFTALQGENLNLMACSNCVLECYDKKIVYRPSSIQDYITKNTNTAFPMSYDNDTPQVLSLVRYYGQVFVEPEVYNRDGSHSHLCKSLFCKGNPQNFLCYGELCHHVLKVGGSILLGGNEDKIFTNLIGLPNRSKTKFVEIKEKSLGGYCVDYPSDAITIDKGKQAGAPNPAKEQAKGARLAIVKETSKHVPIDVSKVKIETGNDRAYNRTLHKEGGSRVLSHKLWHMSNVMGDEPNADDGYNIRKDIIPFLAEMADNPPFEIFEQYQQRKFKMDESFSKKIASLAQADLYLMYIFHEIYRAEGLKKKPRLVVETTEKQKQKSDAYYNFIKEKIVIHYINEHTKERDLTKTIGVFDLFLQYTRWYKTFSPSSFLSINKCDFEDEMIKENRLGPLNSINQWEGIALRVGGLTQQPQYNKPPPTEAVAQPQYNMQNTTSSVAVAQPQYNLQPAYNPQPAYNLIPPEYLNQFQNQQPQQFSEQKISGFGPITIY